MSYNSSVLIIDFDSYIYKAMTASKVLFPIEKNIYTEVFDLDKSLDFLDGEIDRLCSTLLTNNFYLVVSDKDNFRKQLYPDYKSNRPAKPDIWYKLKELTGKNFDLIALPNLEGDDTCRVMFEDPTFHQGQTKILVTVDKDFYSFPCNVFRDINNNNDYETISPEEAQLFLFKQILTGDTCDGYKGIPNFGEKKFDKVCEEKILTYQSVKQLYLDNGLEETDFEKNRILATIIGYNKYNQQTGIVNYKEYQELPNG